MGGSEGAIGSGGGAEGEEESDSSSSSSSSSSEEESDDNDDEDDVNDENAHLSDYERLRLANIKRNEARLARLGLLTTNRASSLGSSTSNNENKKMPPKQVGETWMCCLSLRCLVFFSPQHSTAAEEEAERHHSEEKPAAQALQPDQETRSSWRGRRRCRQEDVEGRADRVVEPLGGREGRRFDEEGEEGAGAQEVEQRVLSIAAPAAHGNRALRQRRVDAPPRHCAGQKAQASGKSSNELSRLCHFTYSN